MGELETMLQQAGTAAPSAPANDPATGTGGAAAIAPNSSPVPAGQPEPDDLPTGVREYLAANPGHKDVVDLVNREMKGAWTPRLQEAAEARKLIEGLDPADLAQLRQIKAAQQRDPQAVAAYLRQYADSIHQQAPAAPDPYAGLQPATPTEEALLKQMAEVQQWRQQQEAQANQSRVQQFAAHATTEFKRLANEYQVEIPTDVQIQAAKHAQATGIPIENALFAVDSQRMITAAATKARNEAAGIVQQKHAQAAGNPGSITPAQGGAPEPNQKRDFKSIMARELAERGIT